MSVIRLGMALKWDIKGAADSSVDVRELGERPTPNKEFQWRSQVTNLTRPLFGVPHPD